MRMTDEELRNLQQSLEYWGNNCGGCETCDQVFRGMTEPSLSGPELHALVVEVLESRKKPTVI